MLAHSESRPQAFGARLKLCWLGLALLVSGFMFGCSPNDTSRAPTVAQAPAVTVKEVVETNMPLTLHALGHVSPFASVAVRSQVNGRLDGVHFKEGDQVKAGDLLFSIDARPFAAALERAKCDLEKDLSLQKQAAIEQQQNAVLLESKALSVDNYNQSTAYVDSLNAAVAADRAAIAAAQVELSFCEIRAPIEGRAGLLQLNAGNVVTAGEMVLVTLNQMEPVFIDFPVPEQELPGIRRARATRALEVHAAPPGEEASCWNGELTAVDNAIEPESGTILLRARFENQDEALWPGQAVNVSLSLPVLTKAVLTPRQAVQKGPNGEYVLVVNPDATIDSRAVETGGELRGEVIVRRGLHSGERVVIGRQEQLAPGSKVRVL